MHGHGRLCGQSWHGAAPSQRRHGRLVAVSKAVAGARSPCALCSSTPLTRLAVCITAAGHNELFATRPSRTAVTTLAGIDNECARLFISRACDAVRDPACSHSGSLTGSPGGCQCERCRSNFENLSCRKLLMDLVSTAVRSADAASDASRILMPRRFGVLQQHFSSGGGYTTTFQLWWGVYT